MAAYEPHHGRNAWAAIIPWFEGLQCDPRFDEKALQAPACDYFIVFTQADMPWGHAMACPYSILDIVYRVTPWRDPIFEN